MSRSNEWLDSFERRFKTGDNESTTVKAKRKLLLLIIIYDL